MGTPNLAEIFPIHRIRLHMKSVDKDEAFEELVGLMVEPSDPDARARILNIIRERENKMSTGIKRGIAVPHGKIPGGSGIAGALGISDRGIEYDALDGKPVHLVFLFTSGESMTEEHLGVLRSISKLAEDENRIEEIKHARSAEEVHGIISRYERSSA